jgi:osmoprotectant transport system ATP-binding protein
VIALRHVSKTFEGRRALDDVSLSVATGTTHVLLGSSGSGKSTILKIVLGLVRPDAGEVQVEPAARIGYVVQDGALFPHLTVARNATLPARAAGWSADAQASRLDALTKVVALEPALLDRFPHQLSSGQRQRAGLLRALILDPPLLLLDEPLGSLDPIARAELQEHLVAVIGELGKTVVVVTHDVREAFVFGAAITLLDRGRVVQQGTFEELARRPAEPFVAEFLRAQAPPPAMTQYL